MSGDLYFQAHKLEDRIHDIDLEAVNARTLSEVGQLLSG